MMVLSSPAFSKRRTELAELAVKHRLPTMFTFKHYVDGGGLMSYGVEYHRCGVVSRTTWREF